MSGFDDPDAVARYAEGPLRMVPGLHDLHKMTRLVLTESAGPDAHVLVLGAGGGKELAAFAKAQPGWSFTGVDPSAEMLALARRTMGDHAARAAWVEGYIDSAPPGPFDAATCLLTLHFLPAPERLVTLRALFARLKPGGRLVVAHHSIPHQEKLTWLTRFAAFAQDNGMPPDQARGIVPGLSSRLPTLSPEEDAALLHQAGFVDIGLFYAAFTFRGWVATRPQASTSPPPPA